MVDIISNFLSTAVGFLWGTPLIVLVLGSGALFTIGTGFFQFRHFGYFCKETFGALFDKSQNEQGSGHVSAFQAAATAVGGAVGVGNIGGVATAIAVGGPGALFWLWIAALLGMALKCAEVSLACYYRSYDENGEPYGGPTYYISKGLGQLLPKGMKLPFILAAIFGIGFSCNWLSGVQAYTITEGFCSAFNLPLIAFGVCYCLVVWVIVLGGGKRVVEFAGKVVPFMIVLFVLAALGIVLVNITQVPAAIALIVKSAFTATNQVYFTHFIIVSISRRHCVYNSHSAARYGLGDDSPPITVNADILSLPCHSNICSDLFFPIGIHARIPCTAKSTTWDLFPGRASVITGSRP